MFLPLIDKSTENALRDSVGEITDMLSRQVGCLGPCDVKLLYERSLHGTINVKHHSVEQYRNWAKG